MPDLNGDFAEGYAPIPISTLDGERISTATAYLDGQVRGRPNLRIMARARVRRVLFDGRRVTGVEIEGPDGPARLDAAQVIVSAGALHSPALLWRSGIGPAERQNHIYLRYGSGVDGCGAPDMLMNFVSKSAWHPIGRRLCTLQTYILRSFSRGEVALGSPEVDAEPEVRFNLLSDDRDLARMKDAVGRMVAVLRAPPVAALARHPFLSSYSDRVRSLGAATWRNRLLTATLAGALDLAGSVRGRLIDGLMSAAPPIDDLLADDGALEDHVRRAVTGVWHPTGTCRIGAPDDPMAVTDPDGRVYGVENLRVADASVMPDIPRANTNVPAIMVGEKIADAALRGA